MRLGGRERERGRVGGRGLTPILFYQHVVDSLDPVCTAMVTLRGAGALHLRGRNTILGVNPIPA
ncbi:hypothetical protein [Streptomyces sp. NPDC051364]|uniref:hypothetical protein n=1 Tax=Streptomyces sp. NPDC051364 TaxID=3155799 RepID=UPI003448A832